MLHKIESDLGTRLEHIAKTAALALPIQEHDEVVKGFLDQVEGVEQTESFKVVQSVLRQIQRANHLETDVYTLLHADWAKDKMIFIAMGSDTPYIGNGMNISDAVRESSESGQSTRTGLYTDSEGTWISAVAPVKTGTDERLMIEVDYNATTEVAAARKEAFWSIVIPIPFFLLFSLAIGGFLANILSRPILKLKKISQEIGDGNYDIEFESASKDEIGQLKSSFVDMAKRIQSHKAEIVAERDRANSANAAKSQFLANMSHEIRTPLNGMMGFLSLLEKSTTDHKHIQYLKTISHSGDMLLSIINDILEFSRIESGRLEIVNEEYDVRTMVEGTVQVLSLGAFEKDLEVPIFIESAVASRVLGDEARIRQVLINVIGNAIKFTHFGEISTRVSVEGNWLQFEVSDTGIGIPVDKQKLIFQPFTQTDESDTRKYGGTGLGLSISKKIIDAMGGQISLESEVGRGTRFFFKVPYKPAATYNRRKLQHPIHCTIAIETAQSLRIWLIDSRAGEQASNRLMSSRFRVFNPCKGISLSTKSFILASLHKQEESWKSRVDLKLPWFQVATATAYLISVSIT